MSSVMTSWPHHAAEPQVPASGPMRRAVDRRHVGVRQGRGGAVRELVALEQQHRADQLGVGRLEAADQRAEDLVQRRVVGDQLVDAVERADERAHGPQLLLQTRLIEVDPHRQG